jgi:methylenetetrahydrofolate dehydrogenase (NADP+) / methenyltetrahydrofolate cyclohydrolase
MTMAEARIIDGKTVAATLKAKVREKVLALEAAHGWTPGLAVVLVGEDPASQVYVRNKGRETEAAGMRSIEHRLPADTAEADLLALVRRLNADDSVHGILVQFPVPAQIDAGKVMQAIVPEKDVDGLNPASIGSLALGLPGLVPCTPLGCVVLAKQTLGDLTGVNALVIGRSNLVGKPVAQLLLAENATVTIAHSRSRDLPGLARGADLLVAAVGRPEMVRGDWIKPGAAVIDVGINRVPNPAKGEGATKLVGDVHFGKAREVAGAITPVPGGVGPMTIACLLANTLRAACAIHGLPQPALDIAA